MGSAMVKTYFANKIKADPKKILSVAVMCCTAKKYEAARPELNVNGMRSTDIVVTTRETVWMIKSAGTWKRPSEPRTSFMWARR